MTEDNFIKIHNGHKIYTTGMNQVTIKGNIINENFLFPNHLNNTNTRRESDIKAIKWATNYINWYMGELSRLPTKKNYVSGLMADFIKDGDLPTTESRKIMKKSIEEDYDNRIKHRVTEMFTEFNPNKKYRKVTLK